MAAEKLTSARLIQIIIMMTLLVTAFVWRTLDYQDAEDQGVCLSSDKQCDFPVSDDKDDKKAHNKTDS